jgi:DNA-binding response OmpR family regulator
MLQQLLQREGYDSQIAHNVPDAIERARTYLPNAIILDIMLGGSQAGLDLLAKLREQSSVPIIMLSGYDDEMTRIRALNMGADDFVAKPFSPGELIARLQSLFRRIPDQDTLSFADLTLDAAGRRVFKAGVEIALTNKEFQILACLVERPDSILSAETILTTAWGPQFIHYIQTLRVHIGNLRKKLGTTPWGSDYIRTVPGVGYGLGVKREQAV